MSLDEGWNGCIDSRARVYVWDKMDDGSQRLMQLDVNLKLLESVERQQDRGVVARPTDRKLLSMVVAHTCLQVLANAHHPRSGTHPEQASSTPHFSFFSPKDLSASPNFFKHCRTSLYIHISHLLDQNHPRTRQKHSAPGSAALARDEALVT